MPLNPSQLCPKCATGDCKYRDGIMCRATPCVRDDPRVSHQDFKVIFDLLNKFHGVNTKP